MNHIVILNFLKQKIVIIGAVAVLICGFVLWIVLNQTASELVGISPVESIIDNAEVVEGVGGDLFISGDRVNSGSNRPAIFDMNVATQDIAQHLNVPAYSYSTDGVTEYYLSYLSNDSEEYYPVERDISTGVVTELKTVEGVNFTSLAVDDLSQKYAYAYEPQKQASHNAIEQTNVAVHDRNGELLLVVEHASEPVFTIDDAMLVMKEDGLYKVNLATEEEILLFGEYTDLSNIDDYAVSGDAQYIVITIPTLYKAVILENIQDDEYAQVSEYNYGNSSIWRSPVLSPVGGYYAISESNLNEETSGSIGVYTLKNNEQILSVPVPELRAEKMRTEFWK